MSEELRKDDEPLKIPETLPVLPLRDIVIFPFMIVPLYVSRDRSIKAVDHALSDNRMILLTAQKKQDQEDPGPDDIYSVGTVAAIMRMLKLPDGRIRVLVQGMGRARIVSFEEGLPHLQAKIESIPEPDVDDKGLEVEALMRNVKGALEKSANLGKPISAEVIVIANNMEEPGRLADLTASNLDLKVEGAQEILESADPVDRLRRVHELMAKELEVLAMQQEISSQAKGEMDRSQREFFLRQQLKAIQSELGEGNELSEEIAALREKALKARMAKPILEEVERQLKKLERMHPDSAETATLRNWLDWMVTLPWGKPSKDNLDLAEAERILDEDHYGLEKVKERIIEYLAVRKLKDKMKGPLLCFVGPPGVGKTSLGRSIARALGRKFVRLSLGGVKDEAEIRGHRRTYVGSMPGRIIQGIQQAGSNNPVFMLDEVDKVGADYRGDPSSALLEVLDPEQNNSFRDHYLGVPFDLSNTLFICTANLTDSIQPAFLDRMEVIPLSGYTEDEKVEIAKRHIVPKQLDEHGLTPDNLVMTERALKVLINGYTREAGLRNLEREIARIARKVARGVAEGKKGTVRVSPASLFRYLGAPKILPDEILKKDSIGTATGLAWTATGGDVLFVEATAMRGKGSLTLTGSLGTVMKESAQAALSFARTRARQYGIREDFFSSHDLHVHVPEGAIPKDGPSAGITIATAMLSVFTSRPVRRSLAMTGEITLRGNVLPIGGLKEKILAARRAGIDTIICPRLNKKELDEVAQHLRRGIKFHLVDEVEEVLRLALIPPLEPRFAFPAGAKPPTRPFPAKPRVKPVSV
ncbi:MAG TPA: endopeptidase La [Vicinamibacteria bacterium]|jgi:ATP-dependent Lon protease|nr:endopeptidase La [Vicinamibacteria bacterium]